MTATARPGQQARYRGVVYGIDLLDHLTNQVVPDDYVGQTRQKGRARENQHRDTQPFSDRIVGSPHVLWEGLCTDDELDAIEQEFIRKLRPRMNWVHNEDNPDQVPKWVQVEQRHERDRAAGRELWLPPDQRQRASLLEWEERPRTAGRPPAPRRSSSPPRKRSRKKLPVRQRRLVGWSVAWLVLAVSAWIALVVEHAGGWQQTGVVAAAGSAALTVWLRHVARKVRRWWR